MGFFVSSIEGKLTDEVCADGTLPPVAGWGVGSCHIYITDQ